MSFPGSLTVRHDPYASPCIQPEYSISFNQPNLPLYCSPYCYQTGRASMELQQMDLNSRVFYLSSVLKEASERITRSTYVVVNSGRHKNKERRAFFFDSIKEYSEIKNLRNLLQVTQMRERDWLYFAETVLRALSVSSVAFKKDRDKILDILWDVFEYVDNHPQLVLRPESIQSIAHMKVIDNNDFFSVIRWYDSHLKDRELRIICREITKVHLDHIQINRMEAIKVFQARFKHGSLPQPDTVVFEELLKSLSDSIAYDPNCKRGLIPIVRNNVLF